MGCDSERREAGVRVAGRRQWRIRDIVAATLVATAATGGATQITVNSADDVFADDGVCTLREAAESVNFDIASGTLPGECAAGSSSGDEVVFTLPPGAILYLSQGAVVFEQSVDIQGPGADLLTITSATPEARALVFDGRAAPMRFTLGRVTISEGFAMSDFDGRAAGQGGGLLVLDADDLLLYEVRFRNSDATAGGAGIAVDMRPGGNLLIQDAEFASNIVSSGLAGGGGAIVVTNAGVGTIRRCLFVDNRAVNASTGPSDEGQGGAIWFPPLATGELEILESTFSGNRAAGNGGAISFGSPVVAPAFAPTVAVTIVDSTFTLNEADPDGNAPSKSGGGLNTLHSGVPVTLSNSIVAENVDGGADPAPDIRADSATLTTGGTNLVGSRGGAGTVFPAGMPNAFNDWVGTVPAPLDPELEPLADNGGFTRSHLPQLSPPSRVIDAGSCPAGYFDQRNWVSLLNGLRLVDDPSVPDLVDGCDIGAIEVGLTPPPDAPLFADDFESGTPSSWSSVVGLLP